MDEWTHHMVPFLGVQLPTPVTLATNYPVHNHVLVKLMETGLPLNHLVKVCLPYDIIIRNVITSTVSLYSC